MNVRIAIATAGVLGLLVACGGPNDMEIPTEEPASTPAPAPKKDVTAAGAEARTLYEELQSFKATASFEMHGFAPGGPYGGWLERVRALKSRTSSVVFEYTYGFYLNDLESLGLLYVTGGNGQTLEVKIEKGLGLR